MARADVVIEGRWNRVLVARGMLGRCHLLLISREHAFSFQGLAHDARREADALRWFLVGALAGLTGDPVAYFENAVAGAITIPHAHGHLIPVPSPSRIEEDIVRELASRRLAIRFDTVPVPSRTWSAVWDRKRSNGYLSGAIRNTGWVAWTAPDDRLGGFWRSVFANQFEYITPDWLRYEASSRGIRRLESMRRHTKAVLRRAQLQRCWETR